MTRKDLIEISFLIFNFQNQKLIWSVQWRNWPAQSSAWSCESFSAKNNSPAAGRKILIKTKYKTITICEEEDSDYNPIVIVVEHRLRQDWVVCWRQVSGFWFLNLQPDISSDQGSKCRLRREEWTPWRWAGHNVMLYLIIIHEPQTHRNRLSCHVIVVYCTPSGYITHTTYALRRQWHY